MKKIHPILVVGILVLGGLGAVGIPIEKSNSYNSDPQPELVVEVRSGFGVNFVIKNVGDADATDVWYFIFIHGGYGGMSPTSGSGDLCNIAPGKSVNAKFRTVGFGIGIFADIPVIDIRFKCNENLHFRTNVSAWIIFNLVLII